MKRIVLVLMVIGIIITGCSADVSDTETYDEPTVFVSNGEESSIVKGVRMINISGELYYDSGRVSALTPRCGTLDGKLKSVGFEFEIPKNSGECNFEGADGYQNTTGMTKEIPIDGDWVIFRKIVDSEKDFGEYTYCFYIRGTYPNAKRESELIVLAKDMDISFEKVAKSLLSSQSTDHMDIYVIPVLPEDKWGIRLSAYDVTPSSLTLYCDQFGGNATGELHTGSWYSLEYLNEDEWQEVEYLPQEYEVAWTSEAYIIKKNDRVEWNVDWKWLYGELPEGMYRINKEITDYRNPGDYDKDNYYALFYVEG